MKEEEGEQEMKEERIIRGSGGMYRPFLPLLSFCQ